MLVLKNVRKAASAEECQLAWWCVKFVLSTLYMIACRIHPEDHGQQWEKQPHFSVDGLGFYANNQAPSQTLIQKGVPAIQRREIETKRGFNTPEGMFLQVTEVTLSTRYFQSAFSSAHIIFWLLVAADIEGIHMGSESNPSRSSASNRYSSLSYSYVSCAANRTWARIKSEPFRECMKLAGI